MNLPILSSSAKRKIKEATKRSYFHLLDRFESHRPPEYVKPIQEVHPQLEDTTIRNLFNRRLPLQLALLVECIKVLKPDFEFPEEVLELTQTAA